MSIKDSLIFLTEARNAMVSMAEATSTLTAEEKKEFSTYVLDEASDYEVMYVMVHDKFPTKYKYHLEGELRLFDKFKEMVIENYDVVSDFISESAMEKLVTRVNSVFVEGYSSARPVAKFLIESGILNEFRDEKALKASQASWNAFHQSGGKLVNSDAKKFAGGPTGRSGASNPSAARVKARELNKKMANSKIWGKVSSAAKNAGKFVAKHAATAGKVVGAAAIIALAAYGAKKAHDKWFSAAAKACKGNANVGECKAKYRANALKAEIGAFKAAMGKCGQSSNPEKCKAGLQARIQKKQAQLSNM